MKIKYEMKISTKRLNEIEEKKNKKDVINYVASCITTIVDVLLTNKL